MVLLSFQVFMQIEIRKGTRVINMSAKKVVKFPMNSCPFPSLSEVTVKGLPTSTAS